MRDEELPGQLTPKLRADTLGHSWWYFQIFVGPWSSDLPFCL